MTPPDRQPRQFIPEQAEIAEAPVGQTVRVTIPARDDGPRRHVAHGYHPTDDGVPARGDSALVIESNTGRIWLLGWEAA